MQSVENEVVWGSRGHFRKLVTGNSTIRYSTYDFLLVFHSNYVPMLHRSISKIGLGYIEISSKIAEFNTPYLYLAPHWGEPIGISLRSLALEYLVSLGVW